MAAKNPRFCINCGESYERQDAGADFVFCPSCMSGLDTNHTRNDLTHRWLRGRLETSDKWIGDGQNDSNWPPGFPDRHACGRGAVASERPPPLPGLGV